jgi:hypothetical protein
MGAFAHLLSDDSPMMPHDKEPPPPKPQRRSSDAERTERAKAVVREYADSQREIAERLRKRLSEHHGAHPFFPFNCFRLSTSAWERKAVARARRSAARSGSEVWPTGLARHAMRDRSPQA